MAGFLVTRPQPDAAETAARLAARGVEVWTAPLLELNILGNALPDADGFDAVALTSINAVRALAGKGELDAWLYLPAYCVGQRTAELAKESGFAKVESAGGGMGDLADLLRRNAAGGQVFYPSGRQVSGDLAEAVAPGVRIERVPVYEMKPADTLPAGVETALAGGEIGAVLLYSKRSAEVFVQLAGGLDVQDRARIAMLCLSEKVAEPVREAGFAPIAVARAPKEDDMLALAMSFSRGEISA